MKQKLGLLMSRHQRNLRKMKKISSKIDMNNLNLQKIFQLLQKTTEKTLTEISALKYFCLNKTNLVNKFLNDKLDEPSYDLVLSLSLSSAYLKTFKKDEIVINIGQACENFYIILKGKAALFGIKKYRIEVSGYEYFLLLHELKKNNDMNLLEKTIVENNRIFPVEYEDIKVIEKIMLKIYLSRQLKRTSPKYLELILDKAGLKHSDFNLESYLDRVERKYADVIKEHEEKEWEFLTEEEKIEEYKKLMIYDINEAWNYSFMNERKIFDQLSTIDIELMKKYTFLTKTRDEEMITYYKCEFLNEIEENEYFGDSEYSLYINKVISLSNDLRIMCIKSDLYDEYKRRVNSQIIGSQINFLLDNFYFHPLYKGFFEKYYFKYFELVEYKMKQIIVKENDPVNFIYFIKSGSVKLISTRSIIENHILIELIKNILLKIDKDDEELKADMNELYNSITDNIEYFNNDMNVKNMVHIMTLQSNNCIGSDCVYYGFNYLYTAEVNSEVVELYKISIDKLMRILNNKNSQVFNCFGQYSKQSLKLFFNRLTKLNHMLLVNLNKSKVRQYGNIFNLNIGHYMENINKNEIKFANKIDKFSFDTLLHKEKKEKDKISSRNKILYKQNFDNDLKESDKISLDINSIKSKFFITQKALTPHFTKLNCDFFSKKEKSRKSREDITQKIIDNLKRSNSLNLFPVPKDSIKDMTSHIKFFDYKENLEKQREKEELRAKEGLLLLEKKENLLMKKLKIQTKTVTNFYRFPFGEKKNIFGLQEDQEEKKGCISFSSNNNIFDLYNRDVFKKNKMIMASLYKNKFSEYFDVKLGAKDFKYDMSRTLLSNKKKFEYSIFDKRFTKNFASVPKKRDRYANIANLKKNKDNKKKTKTVDDNKLYRFGAIKIIPIKKTSD